MHKPCTRILFQDRDAELKCEKNPLEYSDFEEYEDEPPVIVVQKNNCESVDDLADPLALSDTENNSQQKGALGSYAGTAPSSFLNAEVIERFPVIDSSETSSLRSVTENVSQDAAAHTKRKRTFKRMSQCTVIDVEDIIQKQREAHKNQATQVAKCKVCNVLCTCTEFERCVMTRNSDERLNKKYTCSICLKNFTVKFSLKRHMFTHSYVKPFRCLDCNCAYSDKSNLLKHQQKRHRNVKVYTCSLCRAAFSSNSSLLQHRRTVHLVRKKTTVARATVVPRSDHDCYTKRQRNYRNPRSKGSISKNINWLTNEGNEDHGEMIEHEETDLKEDNGSHGEVIQHEEIDLKEESPEVFTDDDSISPAGTDFPFVCTVCFLSFQSYVEFDWHMTEHKQENVCET